jgi:Na+-transporting NADH:ubiquinone oxidoreductase subunit NqrA
MNGFIWFLLAFSGVVSVGRMFAQAFFFEPMTVSIVGPAVAWFILLMGAIVADGVIRDSDP